MHMTYNFVNGASYIRMPILGKTTTYKSIDTIISADGEDVNQLQQTYPVEFLNSVNLPGLPPHELNLKRNSIIMIIRNLSIGTGLCNGTRMVVMDMKPNLLTAKIICGVHSGTTHFIPRVILDTNDMSDVPFNLRRRQFPVKLAYR